MNGEQIYDIQIKDDNIIIYISDVSNIYLEHIKNNYICNIYECDNFDEIFKYQIFFKDNYDDIIIFLRNNGYKYYNSYIWN